MNRNDRRQRVISVIARVMAMGLSGHGQQAAHPKKEVFRDLQAWPATTPGEVTLQGFRPFRAVYDRRYNQASGPHQGDPRHDQVIITAEEVGWDGRRAFAISVLDSGVVEHADTNARSLVMFVAADDLSLLFEAGPIPGKAKDYYLARVEESEIFVNQVLTEAQELKPVKVPAAKPGFGPGTWVMASMDLKPGDQVRLDPYFSPQANPVSQSNYGHVLEERTVEDGSGNSHRVSVVETSGWYSLSGPKVLRLLLKPEPPYLVAVETFDHDTGTANRFIWLRSLVWTTP